MQDKKLKVLLYIGALWAVLFLVTMRVKAPVLEGVEFVVLFAGLCWLVYWTISTIRAVWTPPTSEDEKKDKTTTETMGKE